MHQQNFPSNVNLCDAAFSRNEIYSIGSISLSIESSENVNSEWIKHIAGSNIKVTSIKRIKVIYGNQSWLFFISNQLNCFTKFCSRGVITQQNGLIDHKYVIKGRFIQISLPFRFDWTSFVASIMNGHKKDYPLWLFYSPTFKAKERSY